MSKVYGWQWFLSLEFHLQELSGTWTLKAAAADSLREEYPPISSCLRTRLVEVLNLSALSLENYCSNTTRVSSYVTNRLKHELLGRKDYIS